MQEIRKARLESVLLRELSRLISRELKDPRVPVLTVTSVRVTDDGKQATVHVTPLGGTEGVDMEAVLKGLQSASGFLRKQLSLCVDFRHIPTLLFKEDRGIENVSRVHELLKEIHANDKKPTTEE